MRSLFAALGRFSIRYRWLVVAAWMAGAVTSVLFLPSLAAAVNNNNTQFLPASVPSNVASRLAAPFYGASGNDDAFVVAATASHRPLSPADRAAIVRLTALAGLLPHARAARIAEFSGDGQAAQIEIRASLSQATNRPDVEFVRALRALFPQAGAPPGLVLHTAGNLAVTADQADQASGLGSRTMYLSILLIIVVLLARVPLAAGHGRDAAARRHRAVGRRVRGRGGGEPGDRHLEHHPAAAHRAGARRRDGLRAVPGVPGARGAQARARPPRGHRARRRAGGRVDRLLRRRR